MSHLFPTPSSYDNFELEARIANIFSCIDLFQKTLIDCSPCATNKQAKRRCILELDLEQEMNKTKRRWFRHLLRLFEQPIGTIICDKIVNYLIKALCDTREGYIVQDDHYRLVMNAIITPIVRCIMDEQEMSEEAWDRQVRQKYFLTRLMSISMSSQDHTTNRSVSHSSTCPASRSISGNASRTCWCMPDQASSNGLNGNRSNESGSNGQCCVTLEGILILDILFDAFEIHAHTVLNIDLDIQKQIYHIMNITHLVDIVTHKFKEIKIILKEWDEPDLSLGQSRDDGDLLKAVLRYESKISNLYQLFDINNPMVIFRQDLRNILIIMMTLKPLLKYNEQ